MFLVSYTSKMLIIFFRWRYNIILWLETKNYVGETLSQNVSTYNIHLPIKDQLDKIIILWNKK